ncbi:MAG: hypothetical protein ACK5Q5_06055, partial [Planctomycetaceae bacterium]
MAAREDRVRLLWNDSYNLYIAGALTRVIRAARGQNLVYFCATHGLVRDPTWLADLIAPLADPEVGLAGSVYPCEFKCVAAVPEDIIQPELHVQGGVWAARTDLLREIGISHRFPFEFCDVDLSRRMLAAGRGSFRVSTTGKSSSWSSSISCSRVADPTPSAATT